MGFSGIISNTVGTPSIIRTVLKDPASHWKLVWMSTFMLTVNFYVNHVQDANRDPRLETSGEVPLASIWAYALGGFLVGCGTKLANGCTSGHGVCGLARGSRRSWTAVPLFMLSSMVTAATVSGRVAWLQPYTAFLKTDQLPLYSKTLGTMATAAMVSLGLLRTSSSTAKEEDHHNQTKVYGAAVSAVLAALGLAVSGMTKKSKVNDFLDLCALCRSGGKMDPTLLAVMGSAMGVSWLGYQFVHGWNIVKVPPEAQCQKPVLLKDKTVGKFNIPTNTNIDMHLIGGSILFGIGWGVTGLCPGPALYQMAAGMSHVVLVWFPSFLVGSYVAVQIKNAKTDTTTTTTTSNQDKRKAA